MDASRLIDFATHISGQATLARTVCEWYPYDRPGQGMKVKVKYVGVVACCAVFMYDILHIHGFEWNLSFMST